VVVIATIAITAILRCDLTIPFYVRIESGLTR
jgi:hypothetical protein